MTTTPPVTSAPPAKPVIPPVHFETVPWKRIGLFVLASYAIFAVFAAPFWVLPGGTGNPLFTPVIAVGMFAPLFASVILAKGVEKTSWRTRVGLRFRGRGKQLLIWIPLALVIVVVLNTGSYAISALRGVPLDLTMFTYLGAAADELSAMTGTEVPVAAAAVSAVINTLIGLVITVLATLGEEVGWRGWLWPALRPLGPIRAAVVGGVIWGLWHLPIVLIGYNYTGEPRWLAVPFMILPCIAMSLLFGAFTERAGGNPLPAVVAHAGINSTMGSIFLLLSTPETMSALNFFVDTPLGIISAVFMFMAGLLLIPRQRGTRDQVPA
jgi:membrane protease YdiL (CAAX protease family)